MAKKKKQKEVEVRDKFSQKKWHLFILVIIGFIFFGNSIKNGFSMDDDLVTSTEDAVHTNVSKGISGIPKIFVSRYVDNGKQSYSYRPVTTTTFAVQYSLFGDKDFATRASVSHFINLLLFILNVILVYLVLLHLFEGKSPYVALVCAVLFMIHPLHSEVVNNIKCRDELLVLLFGFSSMLMIFKYLSTEHKNKRILLLVYVFILVAFAVLSKKTGVTFVVTIPLILYYFKGVKLSTLLKIFGVVILGVFTLTIISKTSLSDSVLREKLFLENPLYIEGGLINKIPMFFYTIGWYLKMMVAPYPLSFYYGYDALPIATWSHVLTWIGFLFVVPLTVLSFLRIKKKEVWSFGFLFFMFSIGGISNILTPAPGIVAERFAYLPSFGLIMAAGYYGYELFMKFQDRKYTKPIVVIGSAVLMLVSLIQNFDRNTVWQSKLSLYKNDVVHNDKSSKSFSLLGQEYIRLARDNRSDFSAFYSYSDSAVVALKKSLEIYPGYWTSANNLGFVYQNFLMDNEKSIGYFQQANSLRRDYPEALVGLASSQAKKIDACDILVESLGYVQLDSTVVNTNSAIEFDAVDPIFNAAIFQKEIKETVNSRLQQKGAGLLNQQNHTVYINELKSALSNYNFLENSVLKNQFDYQKEILVPISQALSVMNGENVNDLLQTINQGVAYKYSLFNAAYFKSKYQIETFDQLDKLRNDLLACKMGLIDSTISVYYLAIECDSLDVRYYEELSKFLHVHGKEEEFLKVNNLGVSRVGIDNKVQLYINLANIYNFRKEKELAIMNVNLGLENAISLRDKIVNSNVENKKLRLENSVKTIQNVLKLGVQVANNLGNQKQVQVYTDLLSKY